MNAICLPVVDGDVCAIFERVVGIVVEVERCC